MRRSLIAAAGLILAIGLLVAGGILTLAGHGDGFEVAASVALVLPFAGVGALVAARQPRHPIGWLMLGIGLCLATAAASDGYVQLALDRPGGAPGAAYAAVVAAVVWNIFFLFLILVLVLLPDGRLRSPRWRLVVGGVAVLALSDVLVIFRAGAFDDWETIDNPLGIGALDGVIGVFEQAAILLSVVLLLVSLGSVVLRFRGSTGIVRAQLRWIVTAVAATGLTWIVMLIAGGLAGDAPIADVLWGAAIVSIALIPIGIGIAVLRYRLYEIDRVISKSIVYVVLTLVLGAAYGCLVLVGQALSSSLAGGSNLAIAASTLVVAALFLPMRSRVQRIVDRRFNRRRYDAQRTLEGFGSRLREQIDFSALEADLQGVVTETMQPRHASLWLRKAWP